MDHRHSGGLVQIVCGFVGNLYFSKGTRACSQKHSHSNNNDYESWLIPIVLYTVLYRLYQETVRRCQSRHDFEQADVDHEGSIDWCLVVKELMNKIWIEKGFMNMALWPRCCANATLLGKWNSFYALPSRKRLKEWSYSSSTDFKLEDDLSNGNAFWCVVISDFVSKLRIW